MRGGARVWDEWDGVPTCAGSVRLLLLLLDHVVQLVQGGQARPHPRLQLCTQGLGQAQGAAASLQGGRGGGTRQGRLQDARRGVGPARLHVLLRGEGEEGKGEGDGGALHVWGTG